MTEAPHSAETSEPIEEPANRMFVIKEMEGKDGKPPCTIAFTNFDIAPLTFDELRVAKLHKPLELRLEIHNGKIVDTDIEDIDTSKYAKFRTTLQSKFSSRAISLIQGGWLPSSLAAHRARTTILLDRNTVTEIVSRFDSGVLKGREPDFLDLFRDEPVRINPLLYAIEANIRAMPDAALVEEQLKEVVDKLQKALPKAHLMLGAESLRGALGIIEDTRAGMSNREAFLLALAPILKDNVSSRLEQQRWDEVLAAADANSVPRDSLVVLAALSTVVVPGGASPAKAILKFKQGYTAADAYNALADLRSLEILIGVFAQFPAEITQLCTGDKNLALFWVGIRASGFRCTDTGPSYQMNPVEGIMPSKWWNAWQAAIGAPSV